MQEDIKKLTEEEILKMIRVTIKRNTGITKEFLSLCYNKRRNMRNKIENIQYLLIEKNDSKRALKYIDILLKKTRE